MTVDYEKAVEEIEAYLKPDSITGISYDCAKSALYALQTLTLIRRAWEESDDPEVFYKAMDLWANYRDTERLEWLAGEEQ